MPYIRVGGVTRGGSVTEEKDTQALPDIDVITIIIEHVMIEYDGEKRLSLETKQMS
ncbi:hypothetical protein HPP92_022891 [Vanilla planifolia]|uniref:Uncharacterized protein n=1 Tax=Vanilla planifolia TaxID=51239 RepID=A0A835PVK4_VANPL|nr:hypothetical protein HPP92_022891 [Vanilla planifolia]